MQTTGFIYKNKSLQDSMMIMIFFLCFNKRYVLHMQVKLGLGIFTKKYLDSESE